MGELAVLILAAGKGTRMKSELVKVLHPVAGSPMLSYSLDLARRLKPSRLVVVVGFQADLVRERFRAADVTFALQTEQMGTGHAVMAARPALEGFQGPVLILSGDVPLLTERTVKKFLESHRERRAALSVMTVELDNPKGYGRVFRSADGFLLRITEDRDLKAGEQKIREINTGIYCVEAAFLFSALARITPQNAQKEYYLTDIVARASEEKKKVFPFRVEDSLEVMGINTREELARADQWMNKKMAGQPKPDPVG